MIKVLKKRLKTGLFSSRKDELFEKKVNDLTRRMQSIQEAVEADARRRQQADYRFLEHTHLG
ncbi:hypothetical protein CAX48_13960 [Listeria monocytogenes]|uniref:Uncharacterized protein n=1 Tax=Listeria monocytogenes TaxID=1639 RepID=A0A823J0E5_LISMN|nr:hypothetical protein [Listeria monocytogenes]EAD7213987.1 hypothetical protein [Listeria monocytogenes]EAE5923289.1 hypothetical protein [Listeria monocytogenes]EAG6688916.1 hypothetical protein [Listeria monocytogenes]EAG8561537.1 hypothetical protein [Listeria monocytogenes]EAG9355050.1 hypothetical protein [Listeria monocytogenes]